MITSAFEPPTLRSNPQLLRAIYERHQKEKAQHYLLSFCVIPLGFEPRTLTLKV
jgi:hypothetical protein